MIAFRVVTTAGEAEKLEVALEALQRAGSVTAFAIRYGESSVSVHGSGHAIRFLAAWPTVTGISLDSDDWLTEDDGMGVQRSDAPEATGAFAGAVTAADGTTPLPNIRVRAYLQTGPTSWVVVDTVQTGGDGAYTAAGLEAGIYRAEFYDPAGDYVPEFYDGQSDFAFATNFSVVEGETQTGIDAALAQGGHIAGTVTGVSDGEPIADIVASAWYQDSGWQSAGSAVSSGDGTFDIGGLPAGTYRVRFSDVYVPARYLDEVYDNVLYEGQESLADGDPVGVTAGSTTPNIDAALGGYGKLSGAVTSAEGGAPVDGIYVDVWAFNTSSSAWEWVSGDTTGSAGTYEAGGLEGGDYRVEFSDPKSQYATEFYNNKASIDTGDNVPVELGEETANVDAALDLAVDTVAHSLVQGWNLISFPVTLQDPATPAALETITGTYNVVWAYDGCASSPWLKYDVNDPLSSLTAVDTEHGDWIDMATAGDLTVTGTHPVSTVISLCTGWNLIGYASVSEKPVTEVLDPITGKYDLVYAYVGSDTGDEWKLYNPNSPVGNDLEEMVPWYGYWIHMTEPAVLTIAGR
jgi:hypothetical protein